MLRKLGRCHNTANLLREGASWTQTQQSAFLLICRSSRQTVYRDIRGWELTSIAQTQLHFQEVISMADEKDQLTRRGFLGVGSAAVATTALFSIGKTGSARQQDDPKYKAKSDRSASGPGPTNPVLDAANSDSTTPPATDAGGVPSFKYPFSFSHRRLHEGGWSREVTVRELAVSRSMAGVNMRLTAGGVVELHWHTASEWAFMLYGTARITCIDSDGKSFVTDVKENELWFFPPGIPHSIQGHAPPRSAVCSF